MTIEQNETAQLPGAAERRFVLFARALQDPKHLARFEASQDAREARCRIFAEIDGRAHFLAFSVRDALMRDLGEPFSDALRSEARALLEGTAMPQGESAPPAPARAFHDESPAAAARALCALRRRLRLSQTAFARRYGIPVGTLRDWEQARRAPDACARAYLAVIAGAPEIVPQALRAR